MALEAILSRPPLAIIDNGLASEVRRNSSHLIPIFPYPDPEIVREEMRQTIEAGYIQAGEQLAEGYFHAAEVLEQGFTRARAENTFGLIRTKLNHRAFLYDSKV